MQANVVEAINNALFLEMEKDESVVILGEDVGVNGGVFRATEGLQKKFGERRVIDTPISEAGIIGASIGMAAYGLKPVAEIQFSGFSYLALNQLISHASKLRTRSRGRFSAPLVVRSPYGAGVRALEHHSESNESLFIHIPGLKVVIPSTPYDAKGLLISAMRDPDPVIFFEPMKLYRAFREEIPEESYAIPISRANIVKQGRDATIISWGSMMMQCRQAVNELNSEHIDTELIDLRTLSPFDEETVLESVKKTGRAVIVHEAQKTLGFGAEISARINEKVMFYLKAPILRVTGYDVPVPYFKTEEQYVPSVEKIKNSVKKILSY
ncbi:MAG TPA: alpha-ketoacid dehydrogenase subunit beta [Candidatus Nanoarchaeia archaeon]|nr:alpha-ketoacid dehydrogenase subunit beta [Candidatus Nanoarchaeia archaeon]